MAACVHFPDSLGDARAQTQGGVHGDGDRDEAGPTDEVRAQLLQGVDGDIDRGDLEPRSCKKRHRAGKPHGLVPQLVTRHEQDL